jgi:ribosomal-protein-alanine N-acetyltransferase
MSAPEIETARLRLRQFREDDLDAFADIYSDPDVVKYLGTGLPALKEETAQHLSNLITNHWEQKRLGRWAVIDKADGRLIGLCGLRLLEGAPELVYLMSKPYWGRGLAPEAARACLRYAFEELQLERVVAITRPENAASRRVLDKLGLQYERDARFYDIDCVLYAITRDEYKPDDAPYLLKNSDG